MTAFVLFDIVEMRTRRGRLANVPLPGRPFRAENVSPTPPTPPAPICELGRRAGAWQGSNFRRLSQGMTRSSRIRARCVRIDWWLSTQSSNPACRILVVLCTRS